MAVLHSFTVPLGVQWLSGRGLTRDREAAGSSLTGVTALWSLSKAHPSLVLVQPSKTHPYITERLLMGCKESNQINKKQIYCTCIFQEQEKYVIEKAQLENSLKDMQEQLEHAKKVDYNCFLYMSAIKKNHAWIQRGVQNKIHVHS